MHAYLASKSASVCERKSKIKHIVLVITGLC